MDQQNIGQLLTRIAELEERIKILETQPTENLIPQTQHLQTNVSEILQTNLASGSKFTNSEQPSTSENQQLTSNKISIETSDQQPCSSQLEDTIHPSIHPPLDDVQYEIQDPNQEDFNQMEFPVYEKRAGTVDHGKKYEYLICAYYALKSCCDGNITDFSMTTNNAIYEDFDDVQLTVKYSDKTTHTFLIQLKHSESSNKGLTDKMLAGNSKDFGLLKYIETFKNLANRKNISCILLTNRNAQIQNNSKFAMNFGELTVIQCQSSNAKYLLLNTSENKNSCFYFEPNQGCPDDISLFFQSFYLLTNQNNDEKIESQIDDMLIKMFGCKIDEFISFMQLWWEGKFVLTEHDVIVKLAELALTPFIQAIPGPVDQALLKKSKPLKNATEKFDMTLIKNDCKNIIGQIWTAGATVEPKNISKSSLKYGLCKTGTSQLTSLEHSKVLWFLNRVPLIVKWKDKEDKRIRGAIKLLGKEAKKMRIVMLTSKAKEEFPEWQVFETLHDLQNEETCYTDITENFRVSLQGRSSISLKQLIGSNMEIAKAIETEQLFRMLGEDLCIGKPSQKLPEAYISRNISTLFLDTKKILGYFKIVRNVLLIINYTNQLKNALNLGNMKTKNFEDFLSDLQSGIETGNELVILAKENKCTASNFSEICTKCKSLTIYLLQIIDHNCSTLVLAKGDISSFKKMQYDATAVKEDQFYTIFNNPLNIITGQPGLGKSTLLIYLRQKCPSDCWCVLVKLIEYSSFLSKNPSTNEILDEFLKNEGAFFEKIKTEFQQNGKLFLLLDGLDEISSDSVDTVLDFVQEVYSTGIKVWITSRENLKETVTKRLNSFSIDIQEVTEEEQRTYIHERLGNRYVEEEIEEIISGVFQSVSVGNNVKNILGVPLQLQIITDILLSDKETYQKLKNEDIFVLSKMFRIFFQGKETHQERKAEVKNKEAFNDYFDYKLKLYELPALRTCLDSDTFNKLELGNSREFNECEEFLSNLKSKGDKLGIIGQVVEEEQTTLKAIFAHQSFAEYFTCVWLKNNFDKFRLIKCDFLDVKYQNLRLIFDIMLAEDCPLHLATLYKNPEQVRKYIGHFKEKDAGGRSALHLICTYGANYYRDSERDTTTYIKMFEMLSICDPLELDRLFNWSCLDYALNCKCLYPFEKCCKQLKKVVQCYDKTELAKTCAFCGYTNILKTSIENNLTYYYSLDDGYSLLLTEAVNGYLSTDETELEQMNIETIKMLIKCGCNVNYIDHFTSSSPLHMVVRSEKSDKSLIEVLLENNANVNIKDDDGRTPLLVACGYPNNSNVDLLIRNGANINLKDRFGMTPLFVACRNGICSNVITLLETDVDVKTVDEYGRTMLHAASESANIDVINLLLRNKLDVNAIDKFGETPLNLACKYGTLDTVETLIENGANIRFVNKRKETMLHSASRINDNESGQAIVRFLINQGINIEDKDDEGFTALQVACRFDNYDTIEELIDNGANVNVTTNSKQTLLHLLADPPYPRGEEKTTLKDVIKLLVTEKDLDINAEDENGYTPLHQSAFEVKYIACKTLIECGSNINALTRTNENALHVLIGRATDVCDPQIIEIIKLLNESGINVNQVNHNGDTPLQQAVRRRIEVNYIKALLKSGCDINVKTNKTETLLHLELKDANSNTEVVELLVSKCEQLVNAVDNNQVSPIFLACKFRNWFAINLLLDKGATLNHETWNCLIKDFPNILMNGQVKLLQSLLLRNNSYLEELNTRSTKFPPDFPLRLAKRNGCLQAELLLEMAGYIEEFRENIFFQTHEDHNYYYMISYIIRKFQNSSSTSDSSIHINERLISK